MPASFGHFPPRTVACFLFTEEGFQLLHSFLCHEVPGPVQETLFCLSVSSREEGQGMCYGGLGSSQLLLTKQPSQ